MKTFEIYFHLDGVYMNTFVYAPDKDSAIENFRGTYTKFELDIITIQEVSDEEEESNYA